MPTPKQKKFYITTSIAYANSAPHIGYAMEVLQADVLARYHRLSGEDVFFLSGTDENGAKMKKTAEEKGVEVQKFADENSAKFQLLLNTLNVSNNDFIRTSDKIRHWPSAQKIWQKLVEAGDIYKGNYEGYYCVGCEEYITEKDLINGNCPNHQKAPEKIKEENYFFRLSKYSEEIQKLIESDKLKIIPESRKNEILNVIRSGLKDISFSRPKKVLDWGVPVPNDENQTMYVWCDALTNYISALNYGGSTSIVDEKFKKYWPADVHVIGKDILRFHAAIWPAMLLSAGILLPKKIFVHGFVTSGGQKMSKSIGNVVDPFEVINKYGVDALRYYLLKEIPSGGDGDFSYERFEEVYQADLANGLGNLVARVLTMIEKYFDGKIPEFLEKYKEEIKVPDEIINDFKKNEKDTIALNNIENKNLYHYGTPILEYGKEKGYIELIDFGKRARYGGIPNSYYEDFELNLVLKDVNNLVKVTDKYIQYYEPFKLIKENKEKTGCVLYECINIIHDIAQLISPFMPETSKKIYEQCGLLLPGTKIKKGESLFPRL